MSEESSNCGFGSTYEISEIWDHIYKLEREYKERLQELQEKIKELRNDVKNNYIDSDYLEERLEGFEE